MEDCVPLYRGCWRGTRCLRAGTGVVLNPKPSWNSLRHMQTLPKKGDMYIVKKCLKILEWIAHDICSFKGDICNQSHYFASCSCNGGSCESAHYSAEDLVLEVVGVDLSTASLQTTWQLDDRLVNGTVHHSIHNLTIGKEAMDVDETYNVTVNGMSPSWALRPGLKILLPNR